LKPHLIQQWCIGQINEEYLYRMEDVLHLYSLGYDERFALVCVDEFPYQFLKHVIDPIDMKAGRVKKEDYHYGRCGHCCIFTAFQPARGYRLTKVYKQRKRQDYACLMEELSKQYPNAEKIILVQDNLNTHDALSFYRTFDAQKAFELSQRFEFHYTPKRASWLNMVELEMSCISKQCLNRRIPEIQQLEEELQAICKERNDKAITINWQFTVSKAREKFKKHYDKINVT
jgi:hypothetical protein